MAEYNEVIKQFKRMCWYYSRDKVQKSCPMCTSYPNCNIGQCRKIAFEKPAHFAATVMRWAAENPERMKTTWGEYLCNIGLIHDCTESEDVVLRLFNNAIPVSIAEKLGIQPKEG